MRFVRLVIFGFIALSIVYVLVSLYSRSVRREKLEEEWAERYPDGGDAAAREAFLDEGMAAYHSSLRKRLILLIYILPPMVVGIIMYLVN